MTVRNRRPLAEGDKIVWYLLVVSRKFGPQFGGRRELHVGCATCERTFDGDTGSGDSVYTDESLEENRRLLNSKSYWINGDRLKVDINVDLIKRTLHNLLADPK